MSLHIQGSRRLITYRRIPDADVVAGTARAARVKENGVSADELNPFRKGYFKGFKTAFREDEKPEAWTSPTIVCLNSQRVTKVNQHMIWHRKLGDQALFPRLRQPRRMRQLHPALRRTGETPRVLPKLECITGTTRGLLPALHRNKHASRGCSPSRRQRIRSTQETAESLLSIVELLT